MWPRMENGRKEGGRRREGEEERGRSNGRRTGICTRKEVGWEGWSVDEER